MRSFWIKTVNVLVIAFVLFVYQVYAHSAAKMNSTIDKVRTTISQQEEQRAADSPESGEDEAAGYAYKDGIYEGKGAGYNGELAVSVTVEDGRISSIDITDTADDKVYLAFAASVTEDIIRKQSVEGVDAVTGATFSSNGIIEAVSSALRGARS